MENALKPLAKSVSISLGLTTVASATDIQKKVFKSGMTVLIISNKEMVVIMKIIKSLEESGLLIKGVSETIKNKAKEQQCSFLGLLFGALGANLLGNLLTDKGVKQPKSFNIPGQGLMRAGEETLELVRIFNVASSIK